MRVVVLAVVVQVPIVLDDRAVWVAGDRAVQRDLAALLAGVGPAGLSRGWDVRPFARITDEPDIVVDANDVALGAVAVGSVGRVAGFGFAALGARAVDIHKEIGAAAGWLHPA